MTARDQPLLLVENLSVGFALEGGTLPVTGGVGFRMERGECRAIVGESGSGKSVTALAILDLLPRETSRILAGRVLFQGIDLLARGAAAARQVRGRRIGMVFQDPLSALNPRIAAGAQVAEALHPSGSRAEAAARVLRLFEEVELPDPARCAAAYPHQLSGGQRQRVLIAMAVANDPELLVADEPTTALDVTVQAQILQLFRRLQERRGMGLMLISHDLGVVAGLADSVSVMYAGRVVEDGPATGIYGSPAHPYTDALLRSLPERCPPGTRLPFIPGQPPHPARMPPGCPFAPRCDRVQIPCGESIPPLAPAGPGRTAACPVANPPEQSR